MAKKRKKSGKNKKPSMPVARSAAAVCAAERQRTGGGVHKDKRLKRKDRNSWRKEYLDE